MKPTVEKVTCPLVRKEITRLTCQDVSLSAERMQPVRFAPPEFREKLNWAEICLACSNHDD